MSSRELWTFSTYQTRLGFSSSSSCAGAGGSSDSDSGSGAAAGFAHTYWWVMGVSLIALIPTLLLARIERRTRAGQPAPAATREAARVHPEALPEAA